MQQERGYASAAFFVRVFSDLDGNANVMPMLHPWNLSIGNEGKMLKFRMGVEPVKLLTGEVAYYQDITINPALTDVQLSPPASYHVLAVDGKEIGRNILETVEPLKSATNGGNVPVLKIPVDGNVYFEAESAQVMPAFEIGDDARHQVANSCGCRAKTGKAVAVRSVA